MSHTIIIKEYANSAVMAIVSVNVAQLANFLPEPATFAQAAILAIATGFLGGAGRWFWDRARRKLNL